MLPLIACGGSEALNVLKVRSVKLVEGRDEFSSRQTSHEHRALPENLVTQRLCSIFSNYNALNNHHVETVSYAGIVKVDPSSFPRRVAFPKHVHIVFRLPFRASASHRRTGK